MRALGLAALALVLQGCVTYSVDLRNADNKPRHCEAQGHGLVGIMIAQHQFSDCVNQASVEGYAPDEKTRK